MKIDQHARNVVEGFKKSLTQAQVDSIGEEGFGELHILIEAAIGTATSQALHDLAKQLEKLSKETRQHAASIDALENE